MAKQKTLFGKIWSTNGTVYEFPINKTYRKITEEFFSTVNSLKALGLLERYAYIRYVDTFFHMFANNLEKKPKKEKPKSRPVVRKQSIEHLLENL